LQFFEEAQCASAFATLNLSRKPSTSTQPVVSLNLAVNSSRPPSSLASRAASPFTQQLASNVVSHAATPSPTKDHKLLNPKQIADIEQKAKRLGIHSWPDNYKFLALYIFFFDLFLFKLLICDFSHSVSINNRYRFNFPRLIRFASNFSTTLAITALVFKLFTNKMRLPFLPLLIDCSLVF
jgi:hypothetical protein